MKLYRLTIDERNSTYTDRMCRYLTTMFVRATNSDEAYKKGTARINEIIKMREEEHEDFKKMRPYDWKDLSVINASWESKFLITNIAEMKGDVVEFYERMWDIEK